MKSETMLPQVQDRATGNDLKFISQTTYRGKKHEMSKRTMHQAYHHLEVLVEYCFSFRDVERKARHFDTLQDITEAIYHLKQAMAHLRRVTIRRYNREPDDLDIYK